MEGVLSVGYPCTVVNPVSPKLTKFPPEWGPGGGSAGVEQSWKGIGGAQAMQDPF